RRSPPGAAVRPPQAPFGLASQAGQRRTGGRPLMTRVGLAAAWLIRRTAPRLWLHLAPTRHEVRLSDVQCIHDRWGWRTGMSLAEKPRGELRMTYPHGTHGPGLWECR